MRSGGAGWTRSARSTSPCAARGPAPASPASTAISRTRTRERWMAVRPLLQAMDDRFRPPMPLDRLAAALRETAQDLCGDARLVRARRPHGGRAACRAGSGRRRARPGARRRRMAARAPPDARRTAGAPALWRPPARLHLGPARSAAAEGRSAHPRRAQRRRLAGPAGARSVAGAEGPRRARPAGPRLSHRPRRP